MTNASNERKPLTVLAVYGWREFWSMGEGRGAPSFFLSVTSFPKHGHDMHVLMPGRPGSASEENYHGVTLHRFGSRVNFMPGAGKSKLLQHTKRFFSYLYWFIRVVPAGRALAASIGADVVIGMGELGAPAAYRIARATGVPNVTRLFGIGMFLDKVRGNRLKFLLRYREKRAITTPADYIILCNDGSQGDRLAGLLGVDSDRLLHWFNGVDKKLYAEGGGELDVRARLGIPANNDVVLSVSRLDREKHVDRLLSAAPAVLRERANVTFVIVGSGEERQRLESMAAELGIADSVVFAGPAGREELVDYYRAAAVFVALSDRTNVSNSLHEAMIAGLPAVALNTGATADVVRDGENGVLLEIGDLHRIHEVLLALLADDERRLALGKRAHESADRRLPTFEERQAMEVSVAERAVREHRARVGR